MSNGQNACGTCFARPRAVLPDYGPAVTDVTGWIGEWLLLLVGVALHTVLTVGLWIFRQRPAVRLGLENQRA